MSNKNTLRPLFLRFQPGADSFARGKWRYATATVISPSGDEYILQRVDGKIVMADYVDHSREQSAHEMLARANKARIVQKILVRVNKLVYTPPLQGKRYGENEVYFTQEFPDGWAYRTSDKIAGASEKPAAVTKHTIRLSAEDNTKLDAIRAYLYPHFKDYGGDEKARVSEVFNWNMELGWGLFGGDALSLWDLQATFFGFEIIPPLWLLAHTISDWYTFARVDCEWQDFDGKTVFEWLVIILHENKTDVAELLSTASTSDWNTVSFTQWKDWFDGKMREVAGGRIA